MQRAVLGSSSLQQVSVWAISPVPSYSSLLTQHMPQASQSDSHSCLDIWLSVLRFQKGSSCCSAAARRARRTNDLAAMEGL